VIPAIAALVDTWKRSFSFRPLEPQFREDIKRLNLVVITGTTLLSKSVAVQHRAPSPQQGTETSLRAIQNSDHVNNRHQSRCVLLANTSVVRAEQPE
jgi:hypothetical protein